MYESAEKHSVFPYIGEKIPSSYIRLKQWIEQYGESYHYNIPLSKLREETEQFCEFQSQKSFDSAIVYLSDMHEILVFEVERANESIALVVLGTQYLVNATRMLTLHMDKNASTSELVKKLIRSYNDAGFRFTRNDRDDFSIARKYLDERGWLSHQLAKWLWCVEGFKSDDDVELSLALLSVLPLSSLFSIF